MKRLLQRGQAGIALFQVLLMVAIFTILLLVMVGYSQQSLRQVQAVQDSVETRLGLYSATNYLQHQLLTRSWLGEDSGQRHFGWNFHGHWWSLPLPESPVYRDLPEVRVRLQDERGLLDLHHPGENLQAMLVQLAVPALEAAELSRILQAAQQPIGEQPMGQLAEPAYPHLQLQAFTELELLPQWQPSLVARLKPWASLHGGIFNPAMAPDGLLAALLPEAELDIIRQWRQDGVFDVDRFSALTGIEGDEIVSLYPGNTLTLELVDEQTRARVVYVVKIDPYNAIPVTLFSRYYGY